MALNIPPRIPRATLPMITTRKVLTKASIAVRQSASPTVAASVRRVTSKSLGVWVMFVGVEHGSRRAEFCQRNWREAEVAKGSKALHVICEHAAWSQDSKTLNGVRHRFGRDFAKRIRCLITDSNVWI